MKLWLATIDYAWPRVANVVQAKFGRTTPRFEISTRLTDFSPEVPKRKNFWEMDCCCFKSEMAVDDVLTNCKKRVFKRPTWLVTCILVLILFCCCCCCFCFCLFVFFRLSWRSSFSVLFFSIRIPTRIIWIQQWTQYL